MLRDSSDRWIQAFHTSVNTQQGKRLICHGKTFICFFHTMMYGFIWFLVAQNFFINLPLYLPKEQRTMTIGSTAVYHAWAPVLSSLGRLIPPVTLHLPSFSQTTRYMIIILNPDVLLL